MFNLLAKIKATPLQAAEMEAVSGGGNPECFDVYADTYDYVCVTVGGSTTCTMKYCCEDYVDTIC